ncbi:MULTISPECIES: peptidylprolyl isomerase [Fusobacterium]|uniref:peptidylprolyl isomerase n=1 Tax=Fusobacterium TaxID=848 RepID=UPI001F2D6565|nr:MULTISPECIES: peptidylprolyl isomerase [Fusobacterium]MCF2611679.1 peptidylprolyl isomerase [Fusobacterium perfoetens]MDY2980402.1 peptidylprolyl isomerase [Fusobacterium sp.]
MAIRKFRQRMKVITLVITIAFAVSSAALYVMNQMSYTTTKNYAFKINGNKVKLEDVMRSKSMLANNFRNEIDEDIIGVLALNQVVENELAQELADSLKIKISSKDINNEYQNIESNFKDKEQFKRMLTAQGYTKASLKKELEKSMRSIKAREVIGSQVTVTDEEIGKYYEENKFYLFQGLPLEDVKERVKQYLIQEKANDLYQQELEKLKDKMVLSDVNQEFDKYMEKVQVEKDGVEFTNVDYSKIYITFISNGLEKEAAKEETDKFIESQVKMVKAAEDNGIEIAKDLPVSLKVKEAYEKLYSKLESQVVVNDEELNKFFEANRMRYDIYPSADAYIAYVKLNPSDADKKIANEKAKEILKTVNKDNFASIAKEKSECPSAANGGELGWFTKEDMVAEFSDAAFKGKAGEIYPEVVDTVFGSHIIFVQEKNEDDKTVRASHILVKSNVSPETIAERVKLEEEQALKLSNGEIKFENLPKDRYVDSSLFTKITEQGYIPGIGYKEELAEEIYKAPLNKVVVKNIGKDIYVFQKIKEVQSKKMTLDEVKEQVTKDYKAQKTMEEIQNLLK